MISPTHRPQSASFLRARKIYLAAEIHRRPARVPEYHTRCWYRVWYSHIMATARKITVEIPDDLLAKAQQASGAGITETVRTGLQLLAASQAYDRLLQLRGKVRFSRTFEELKDDR
jgi:hypothetical protein